MRKIFFLVLLISVHNIDGQVKYPHVQQINKIHEFISFISENNVKPLLKDYIYFIGNDFELEIDEIDRVCSKNCKRMFNEVRKRNIRQKSYLLERMAKDYFVQHQINNKEKLEVFHLKGFHNTDIYTIKKNQKDLYYFIIPNESDTKKLFITEILDVHFKSLLSGNDASFYFR